MKELVSRLEKLNKLEEVSGHDIDTLISLFESGCRIIHIPQFYPRIEVSDCIPDLDLILGAMNNYESPKVDEPRATCAFVGKED